MDIITRMDYRNGHYTAALGALNAFYLHKFCSRMNSLHYSWPPKPSKYFSVGIF